MNNLMHDIEMLKKEIWFLKNTTIKNLLEEVAGLTGGNIDSTLIGRIKDLEAKMISFEDQMATLENDVKTNTETMGDVSLHVSDLAGLVEGLKTSFDEIKVEIESLKDSDEVLAGSINTISDNISSMDERLVEAERIIKQFSSYIGELAENDLGFDLDIENLRKDIVRLDDRIDNISSTGSDSGEIEKLQEQIDALGDADLQMSAKVINLQNQHNELSENFDRLNGNFDILTDAVATHNTQINTLTSDVSDLKNTNSTFQSQIDDLKQEDVEINEEINSINLEIAGLGSLISENAEKINENASSISNVRTILNEHGEQISLIQEVDEGQNNDIAQAQADISSLASETQSLSTTIDGVSQTVTENATTLASLQAEIQSLREQIANAGGESVDVLYDMRSEDPEINKGYTEGIISGEIVTMDFTPYKKVRFFASLIAKDCQKEVDIINRNYYDTTLMAADSTTKKVSYLRAIIPKAKNKLQVQVYGVWTFSNTDNTLTVDYGTGKTNIFIFRVEGIR